MDSTTFFDRWSKTPSTTKDVVAAGEAIPYLTIFYGTAFEDEIIKLKKQHETHPDITSGMMYFAKNSYV